MSLPPSILKIKRKRGADEPPATLQIEQQYNDGLDYPKSKRRTGLEEWVFQRVPQHDDSKGDELKQSLSIQNPWEAKIPIVKATQPGDELRAHATPRKEKSGTDSTLDHNAVSSIMPAASATSSPLAPGHNTSNPPRRFHLTRATEATPQISSKLHGIRKTRGVATFMERNPNFVRAIKKQAGHTKGLQISPEDSTAMGLLAAIPERALRKPGRNASKSLKNAPPALTGRATHDDVGSEQLAAEMQKFSIATMARELAEKTAELPASPRNGVLTKKAEPNFKPKPPAQRYNERHANETHLSKQPSNGNEGDDGDTEDESDYVTHTYVRVPAHTLQILPADLGVLVIENEEEMQTFCEYGEDSDDDSDIFDDEIDENAENNPNNEYPDEEVASDDEFDLNAYHYRQNASDDEEFDFDEANWSDDGNDLPWIDPTWERPKKTDDNMSDS